MGAKKRFNKGLIILGAYLVFLLILVTGNTIDKISRTDISSLELTGMTVNQIESTLKSEGIDENEYMFITEDGSKPGKAWKIEKVEDARIARIFVKTEPLPTFKSLNIVGLRWIEAEAILERSGFYNQRNYVTDSNGQSVWAKNNWIVLSISDTQDSKAPTVKLKRAESSEDRLPKDDSKTPQNKETSPESQSTKNLTLKSLIGTKNSE